MGLFGRSWWKEPCEFCKFQAKDIDEACAHRETHIPDGVSVDHKTYYDVKTKEQFSCLKKWLLDDSYDGCRRSHWKGPGWYTRGQAPVMIYSRRLDMNYEEYVDVLHKSEGPAERMKENLKNLQDDMKKLKKQIASVSKKK